ncbi:hypothetical protein J3R30DRAFT_3406127 [Lentinula aciculospora]|uniref:Uncharacterized protein n=1 Tax=Lentinula aciculospora TaxID=153920 RepID=A0A9W9DL78_9AGAR|nr:hypothetical protein J3R30DRAFT_3406127 [Lentinula aciculospora]
MSYVYRRPCEPWHHGRVEWQDLEDSGRNQHYRHDAYLSEEIKSVRLGSNHIHNTLEKVAIVKVIEEMNNNAWGEVRAMKDAGNYIDSVDLANSDDSEQLDSNKLPVLCWGWRLCRPVTIIEQGVLPSHFIILIDVLSTL